jgi:methyltransferase-like protein
MATSYDQVPYMGRVHQQTHIEKLALTAKLFHLEHADISNCRVLELGCGDGSNLLNMAYNLPNSTFVGIDGSEVQVQRGQVTAETSGIHNVELLAMDIMNIDETLGKFDYIICHGVFSWVSEPTRKKILDICRERMTPLGISYISYNAYPGWKLHGMIRDMMRFHSFKMDGTENQIPQGRAVVQFVSQHILNQATPYAQFIRSQVDFISGITDEYLYHEYLEDENQPFYFHEFVNLAAKHNLQYLGDTDFNAMTNMHWPQETRDILNNISPSIFELEQYMDLLRCRRFRCTLLVHHERSISREVDLQPFQQVRIAYKACPKWVEPEEDDSPPSVENTLSAIYISKEGQSESQSISGNILYQTALTILHNSWPESIHFDELCHQLSKVLNRALSNKDQENLAHLFQTLFLQELITLHLHQPQMASEISEQPMVPPLARHMATYQQVISTQLHDMVTVRDSWVQAMVQLLNGEHTVDKIAATLLQQMNAGELPPLIYKENEESEEITDPEKIKEGLQIRINEILNSFLENGVLQQ